MEDFLVMATARAILFLALASLTLGCFDVHTVNSRTWLVDDFENPNGTPLDFNFERWECRPNSNDHPIADEDCNITLDLDPARLSKVLSKVLHLGATLYPSDATFARSEVATVAAPPGLDLSSYGTFQLSAKLAPRDISSITPQLIVQLVCKSACPSAARNSSNNPCSITRTVEYTAGSWEDHALDLSKFLPAGNNSEVKNSDDCLTQVDGIKVTVDSSSAVLDGVAKFDLYVDDIYLTPRN
jgi:hypothetical protein